MPGYPVMVAMKGAHAPHTSPCDAICEAVAVATTVRVLCTLTLRFFAFLLLQISQNWRSGSFFCGTLPPFRGEARPLMLGSDHQ